MYGTIFHMKVKPGPEQRVVETIEEWERERKPNVDGALTGLLMKPDANTGELIGVAVFKDKSSYTANAGDPEQGKWLGRLRELLEADPVWEDGEFVAESL